MGAPERAGDAAALVTGGSRGIGRAIVLALAERGCRVAFTYREKHSEAGEVLSRLGHGVAIAIAADARSYEGAREAVAETRGRFGKIDFLVNNAGVVHDRLLMTMPENEWHEVIDTNLTGTFNFSRAAIVEMMKVKAGRILNITSISGITGVPGQTNYSASKAGVIGFTKALAREVAPLGIAVNALALGFINTGMTGGLAAAHRTRLLDLIPMRRFGTVEEAAKLACFLLAEAPSYLTGAVVRLDGGMAT